MCEMGRTLESVCDRLAWPSPSPRRLSMAVSLGAAIGDTGELSQAVGVG
jgi:hypothetical protein